MRHRPISEFLLPSKENTDWQAVSAVRLQFGYFIMKKILHSDIERLLVFFLFSFFIIFCSEKTREAKRTQLFPELREKYPIWGIDVSHYQGKIDWKKTKGSGLRFAYIKATEGTDFVDSRFERNWKDAKRLGVPRGAYHFYRLCKDAKKQAANFIRTVPAEFSSLPPVIDLELHKNCSKPPNRDAFLRDLKKFSKLLEKEYEKKPILYVIWDFYEKYLIGEVNDFSLWISDPWGHEEPVLPEVRKWTLWQYDYKGRLKGISGDVDLNFFNGDEEQFQKFLHSR